MAVKTPSHSITDIKNAADILDVVSDAVNMKKAGRNYVGLCPFHSEKTPSFSVNPEKQIFHCFGCGEGGDVFTFLIKYRGFSFYEALKELAARQGISLPEKGTFSGATKKEASVRERLFSTNKTACEYFRKAFSDRRKGVPAIQYLDRRKITPDMIDAFQIGFAPEGWDGLIRFFRSRGVSLKDAEQAGLVVPRASGKTGYYDRFRNRVIFPIFDTGQRVTGFGGRVLNDELPKYLNSPETAVFNKRKAFYGIEKARTRARQTGIIFVVEGYFDVIALHQFGVENTVATLGTALTEDHVRLLSRMTDQVVLLFDSDKAGIKAAERSADLFLTHQVEARIMILPEGHDPDSFVFHAGKKGFDSAAENTLGMVEFLLKTGARRHGDSVEGRVRLINDISRILAKVDDEIPRALYVKSVSEQIGVEESAVSATVGKFRKKGAEGIRRGERKKNDPAGPSSIRNDRSGTYRLAYQIIAMMINFPDIRMEISRRRLMDLIEDVDLKAIGDYILTHDTDGEMDASTLLEKITDAGRRRLVAEMTIEDYPWQYERGVKLLEQLTRRRSNTPERLAKIRDAQSRGDEETLIKLLKEHQRVSTKLR